MLAANYSVTEDRHPKVVSMMVMKCVNTWPVTTSTEVKNLGVKSGYNRMKRKLWKIIQTISASITMK